MGFFDEYEDTQGLSYVTADEKKVLINNETALPVRGVVRQEVSKYGPRFLLKTVLPGDDADRVISFNIGTVESRDRLFETMIAYVEKNGEDAVIEDVKLEQSGASILVVKA